MDVRCVFVDLVAYYMNAFIGDVNGTALFGSIQLGHNTSIEHQEILFRENIEFLIGSIKAFIKHMGDDTEVHLTPGDPKNTEFFNVSI